MTDSPTAVSGPIPDRLINAALTQFGSIRHDGVLKYGLADVTAADDNGLLGLVANARSSGRIALASDSGAMLDALLVRASSEAVLLESRAVAAVAALRSEGIDTRVLKGIAVSHLDYHDPCLRQFGDIDLLVRGGDIGAAVAAFARLGYTRHFPEPFDGFDEHIGKGVAVGDDSRTVIDLHRTLALGYYGTRLPVGELWLEPQNFEMGGETISALIPPLRFVHCALHLALSPTPRISDGLDLVTITHANPDLTASEIVTVAESWGCAHPLALAVEATSTWFGNEWAPADLVARCRTRHVTITDRLLMSSFAGPLSNSHFRSLCAVAGLRGRSDRHRALRGLVSRGHRERE